MLDPLTASVAKFQLTAARRRLGPSRRSFVTAIWFQLTAARRRLDIGLPLLSFHGSRFNSQPPEGGWVAGCAVISPCRVSTHSRPKAAGPGRPSLPSRPSFQLTAARRRLAHSRPKAAGAVGFNSQPPEGGWDGAPDPNDKPEVSTHSRPKAAGI